MASMEQTLAEAIAILGITTKKSKIEGKKDWFTADGTLVGSYDAHEGWKKIERLTHAVIREMDAK